MTSTPTLLAIFAHPDDEAFSLGGTLTHYARRGVRVVLACATRGEAGKITVPGMTVEDLGAQREQELRDACMALEIPEPVFLDYHDSGRYERTRHNDPRALMNVTPMEIEVKLRVLIEQVQPQVMVTFDPHGGYGHIDHLQIQRAATGAFFSTGHLPLGGPQRLYYTALPYEAAEGLALMGQDLDPLLYGVSPQTVAVRMDVSAYAENKKAALAAHGTQMGEQSLLGRMAPDERARMEARMLGQEIFTVGGTRTGLPSFPLRGLFDGLPGLEALDD
ncbi:PIG-L deacetylase family protein [Deinococcus deserti]|uniref:Putative LmbE-like protein putative GlcNAc-PI de-N-acetylase (PIG-L family) n=1 Tax=Deinococcus deserti (strain DSM 17065 / CIP 109153 / LMG 22923 / VCD115) TaxID=546414 RepID=C1CV71_DEIDV|nr:PIG-L deacetylase family protein [Deinococcus deserti]ACO46088.2 putative LmbE-like protein; putative GlcNAc-PI de-N-acetylase (PIG-L family) [Deinococcus deserti VCD115]